MDRRTESLVSLADYLQSFLHFVASHSLSLSLFFGALLSSLRSSKLQCYYLPIVGQGRSKQIKCQLLLDGSVFFLTNIIIWPNL
jgi:Na+-transporting NADH:ubiquinone oxidoreductase subunit NqrD